jgi:hypothetical protein
MLGCLWSLSNNRSTVFTAALGLVVEDRGPSSSSKITPECLVGKVDLT